MSDLGGLETLSAGFNPLEATADLSRLVRLQRLDLRHAGLTDLDGLHLLGDIEELRITENPALPCEAVRQVIAEFGAAAVAADERCTGGVDQSSNPGSE